MKLASLFQSNISENRFVQVLRFTLIGGFTALVDFLTLWFLVEIFHVGYLLSAAAGFLLGSSLNYILSIKWVFFRGRFNKYSTEFSVFILLTFLGLILNQVVMYLFTGLFLLNYLYSKLFALVGVTVFNFLTKKYIVFIK
jgi:putative flippase GtrA